MNEETATGTKPKFELNINDIKARLDKGEKRDEIRLTYQKIHEVSINKSQWKKAFMDNRLKGLKSKQPGSRGGNELPFVLVEKEVEGGNGSTETDKVAEQPKSKADAW